MFLSFVPEARGRDWADGWLSDAALLLSEPVEPAQRAAACLWVGRVDGRGELAAVWRAVKRYGCAVCLNVAGDLAADEWRFDFVNGSRCFASRETVLRQTRQGSL